MENGPIRKSFGYLIADISIVIAEKNKLYLRKYNVTSSDGDFSVSFILGHAALLFGMSSCKFREELLNTENIKGVITLKQSVFEQIVMPAAVSVMKSTDLAAYLFGGKRDDTTTKNRLYVALIRSLDKLTNFITAQVEAKYGRKFILAYFEKTIGSRK